MQLSDILTGFDSKEKTASVNSPLPKTADDFRSQLEKVGSTEVPSTNSPIEGLFKVASELAKAESHSLEKEAQLYGAAMADGFVQRLAQYDLPQFNSSSTPIKTASQNPIFSQSSSGGLEKDSEAQLQAAYDDGFNKTAAYIEKTAKDVYAQAYDQTVVLV